MNRDFNNFTDLMNIYSSLNATIFLLIILIKIIKNDNLKIVNNIENPILQAQKRANIQHITIITGKYLIIFLFLFKALYLLFFHLI